MFTGMNWLICVRYNALCSCMQVLTDGTKKLLFAYGNKPKEAADNYMLAIQPGSVQLLRSAHVCNLSPAVMHKQLNLSAETVAESDRSFTTALAALAPQLISIMLNPFQEAIAASGGTEWLSAFNSRRGASL
jgi:hypothetical protein